MIYTLLICKIICFKIYIKNILCGSNTRVTWNFIYVYFVDFYEGRKEGNVLFNDALNTFYLRLYGIRNFMNACLCFYTKYYMVIIIILNL